MTRTFIPLTSFVSSPETEKERLLYTSASVASGFYTKHGFLITQHPIPKYKNYSIVMPEVLKNVSQNYWKDAAHGGNFMPKKLSSEMWEETKNIYLKPVDNHIVERFESQWKKVEANAWSAIRQFFPAETKWIGSLEVRITKIGSLSSHYLLEKRGNQHLIINLREDADFKEIINLLILALIYPMAKDFGITFTYRQSLRNFILSRKNFNKVYPDFKPKIYDNLKIPTLLKRKSEKYILDLGIPNIVDSSTIIDQNVANFGVKEIKLLRRLIEKNGNIADYNEIADLIWGQGEFKSYWAINKLIQRIQKKITGMGIENLKIQGVRGVGYKI